MATEAKMEIVLKSQNSQKQKETKADADDVEFDPFADNDGDDEATAA